MPLSEQLYRAEVDLGTTGTRLSFKAPETEISCERIRKYPTQLALIVALRNDQLAGWEAFLERCRMFMEAEFRVLFELTRTSQWDQLGELLEQAEVAPKRRQEISKLTQQAPESGILEVWEKLENFLEMERADTEKSEYYFKAQELKRILEEKPYDFSQKLGLIVLAIKMENLSWAKRELHDFLNFHPARLSFEVHRNIFNKEWDRERFEKLMLDIGLVIGNFFKKSHPLEADIFMTLMEESLNSRTFESLSSKFQTQWSLARLREAISSGQKVSAFPSFWYSQLSHRTSRGQVDVFIKSLFKKKVEGQLNLESLWIFTETMPSDEEKREKILDVILETDTDDDYHKYIVLELVENEAFKRLLSKKRPQWDRPDFQLKRSVYRELFWNNSNPELMLFFLLSLGDYNHDYLWGLAYPKR